MLETNRVGTTQGDQTRAEVVLGRYVLRRELGSGGMGTVYAAYDPRLDREVAVKVLHRATSSSGEFGPMLIREARALARLAHPHVVQVYDVGLHEGAVFIAMELVTGLSLRVWLGQQPRPWRDVLRVFLQAGRGLSAAHGEGLIHRDFKPDNCLFGTDGRVRVVDFGLVRHTARARPELAQSDDAFQALLTAAPVKSRQGFQGTPAYMAPEQFSNEPITEQVDQFAFSVALWEALLGVHPFPHTSLPDLVFAVTLGQAPKAPEQHDVPEWLLQVLRRGLAVDAGARHPSMASLLAGLEEGLSSAVPGVPRLGWRYERSGARVRDRLTGRSLGVEAVPETASVELLERLSTLRHPNLAKVVDVVLGAPTELLLDIPEGVEPLAGLEHRPRAIILPCLSQLASALDALHRAGLTHGHLDGSIAGHLNGHVFLRGLGGARAGSPGKDVEDFRSLAHGLLGEPVFGAGPVETLSQLLQHAPPLLTIETPEARESILQTAPLTGRDDALGVLYHAFGRAVRGHGSLLLVVGESGVGKSRVLLQFAAHAKARGALVLTGEAHEGRAEPFQLWREPLLSLALATPLLDEEVSAFRVAVPELDQVLGRNVGIPPEIGAATLLGRLRSALWSLLARVKNPVVILLDDLHWAGSESRALLEGLAQAVAALRVVVVVSARSDEGPLPELGAILPLSRLDAGAVSGFTRAVFGAAGARPDLIEFIQSETEGNPFFLVEATRALAERAGGLDRVGSLSTLPEATTVGTQRALERRLRRIPLEDHALLELSAVAGRRIDERLLQALAPEVNVAAWLERARGVGVLEWLGDHYRFSHSKLCETIEASLDEERRKALHLNVARALEGLYGDRAAPSLSLHYGQACNTGNEARYAHLAGVQALKTSPVEARRYLERALRIRADAVAQAELHRRLGEACYELADFDATQAHLTRALALLGYRLPRTTLGWWWMLLRQISVQTLRRRVKPRPVQDASTLEASRAAGRLAKLWAHRPDPVRLMSLALLAVNLGERTGTTNVYALGMLGYAAGMAGFRQLPATYFGLAHAADAPGPEHIEVRVMEAMYLGCTGQPARSVASIEEGLALARECGDRFGNAAVEAVRAHVMWFFGRLGEMSASFERSVAALSGGEHGHRATFLLGRGLSQYLEGELAPARETVETALSNVSPMDHAIRASGLAVRSLVCLELGEHEAGVRDAETILELLPKGGLVPPIFFHIPMACFEAHAAAGNVARLPGLLAFAEEWAKNSPLGEPQVELHRGRLWALRGDRARAEQAFRRGHARSRELGTPLYEGLCALELGDHAAASAVFEAANAGLFLRKLKNSVR